MRLTVPKAKNRIKDNGGIIKGKTITFQENSTIGLKLWSAIDYLVNHNGFNFIREIDIGLKTLKG